MTIATTFYLWGLTCINAGRRFFNPFRGSPDSPLRDGPIEQSFDATGRVDSGTIGHHGPPSRPEGRHPPTAHPPTLTPRPRPTLAATLPPSRGPTRGHPRGPRSRPPSRPPSRRGHGPPSRRGHGPPSRRPPSRRCRIHTWPRPTAALVATAAAHGRGSGVGGSIERVTPAPRRPDWWFRHFCKGFVGSSFRLPIWWGGVSLLLFGHGSSGYVEVG